MGRLIFITPFFTPTGSEVALFNLLTRIKNQKVIVISRSLGSLHRRLPADVLFYDFETYQKRLSERSTIERLSQRIRRQNPGSFYTFLNSVIGDGSKDLFYVNTLMLPSAANFLIERKYRYVLHVHEMQQMYAFVKENDLVQMLAYADFVFCSSSACKNSITTFGRTKDISVSYPGIDVERIASLAAAGVTKLLKSKLGIPDNAFVIVMSGTLDANKNPEALLFIGKSLLGKGYPVHLLWIGSGNENGFQYFVKQKVLADGLAAQCTFVDRIEDDSYYLHMNLADVVVLTSHYESFSLILVEALALGKPVFSFTSGGPQEIITTDEIGVLVKGHDVNGMALALEQLINGKTAFKPELARARANEFSIEVTFNAWAKVMDDRYSLSLD